MGRGSKGTHYLEGGGGVHLHVLRDMESRIARLQIDRCMTVKNKKINIPSTKTNPRNVNADARMQTKTGKETRPIKLNRTTDVKERSLASIRICSSHD